MKLLPKLTPCRFAKLEAGDLFIYPADHHRCLALRGVDRRNDGDPIVLLLGPGLSPEQRFLVTEPEAATVVAIGKEYVLRLPIDSGDWQATAPGPDLPCLYVVEDKAYYRGYYRRQSQAIYCWIEIESGIMEYDPPPGTGAYALNWDIVIQDPNLNDEMVIRLP